MTNEKLRDGIEACDSAKNTLFSFWLQTPDQELAKATETVMESITCLRDRFRTRMALIDGTKNRGVRRRE